MYGTDGGSAATVPDLSAASAAITLEVAPVQSQTLADAQAAEEPVKDQAAQPPTVPQQAEPPPPR